MADLGWPIKIRLRLPRRRWEADWALVGPDTEAQSLWSHMVARKRLLDILKVRGGANPADASTKPKTLSDPRSIVRVHECPPGGVVQKHQATIAIACAVLIHARAPPALPHPRALSR